MTIHRIHSSTSTANPSEVGRFYRDIFGMDCRMGAGWSVTLEPGCAPLAQLEADDDDVDDVDVPGLEVEVEDVEAVHLKAHQIGAEVPFGPWTERSGVRRIFLRDPAGALVSVTSREAAARAA